MLDNLYNSFAYWAGVYPPLLQPSLRSSLTNKGLQIIIYPIHNTPSHSIINARNNLESTCQKVDWKHDEINEGKINIADLQFYKLPYIRIRYFFNFSRTTNIWNKIIFLKIRIHIHFELNKNISLVRNLAWYYQLKYYMHNKRKFLLLSRKDALYTRVMSLSSY